MHGGWDKEHEKRTRVITKCGDYLLFTIANNSPSQTFRNIHISGFETNKNIYTFAAVAYLGHHLRNLKRISLTSDPSKPIGYKGVVYDDKPDIPLFPHLCVFKPWFLVRWSEFNHDEIKFHFPKIYNINVL